MILKEANFNILLVDDEIMVLNSLKRILFDDSYKIVTASSGKEALQALQAEDIQLALLDLRIPDTDGLSLLKEIKKKHPQVMIVIHTGYGNVKDAVSALKSGATDFLEKTMQPDALQHRISQLYRVWQLKQENKSLRSQIEDKFSYDRLVGNSSQILAIKNLIMRAGPTDMPVLITGETGTGKELCARAIHRYSQRMGNPFVPVDCAAISEQVFESELFGHVKGAYTGADHSTTGLIRSANLGTLFLDEVAELGLNTQVKLLRTLQEYEVRPVGSVKRFPADFRVIAATNRNLSDEVDSGRFRQDLFYRLNGISLSLPPLRERQGDIPLLARYFLSLFREEHAGAVSISREALALLESYHWPGNVRELENVLRRFVVLSEPGSITITEDDLSDLFAIQSNDICNGGGQCKLPASDSLEAYVTAALTNALKKTGGNRKKASALLGIGEATLYRKLNTVKNK